ncbi:ABC transporter substrate-binding protein [Ornithinibacillus sp. 4-3]|uniref:ABC transporter substrate-binding protein n=1 Tax=Ornithinibacillus sp. 4-3 TaxID=3231488 RepID=A0AB39HR25_9BACI
MKSTRILLTLFLVLLVAIGLIGCSSNTTKDDEKDDQDTAQNETDDSTDDSDEDADEPAASGGTLRIAYSAQPPSLDQHLSTAAATTEIMGSVYEQLISVDSEYQIVPQLAESFEQSDDGLEITFKLREGVLFHNGKEMKAEDVVASMNRWKDLPGGRGQFDDAIFEEIDEYTVVFKLDKPLSTALTALSQGGTTFSGIMPKEVVEAADETGVTEFIGTGPFKFVEWAHDQHVKLEKFDDYVSQEGESNGLVGEKAALVDEIIFEFVLDPSTRVAGIQSGQYDIVHNIPNDNAILLEGTPGLVSHVASGISTMVAIPNKSRGIFSDVRAREMLAALIDYDEVMTAAYADPQYYRLSHGMMLEPQEAYWYSEQGKEKFYQNDPEKAKKILEEIGYDGETVTIITDREYVTHYNAAVVLQKQLESIGMNVELQVYDWATLLDKVKDPNEEYDLYAMGHSLRADPTAIYYFGKGEGGFTESEELDQLLEEFRNQPTLDDTKEVFDRIQKWHWEYIPALKLGEVSRTEFSTDKVEGLRHQGRMLLWNVSKSE